MTVSSRLLVVVRRLVPRPRVPRVGLPHEIAGVTNINGAEHHHGGDGDTFAPTPEVTELPGCAHSQATQG